jgi:hypothetical protein
MSTAHPLRVALSCSLLLAAACSGSAKDGNTASSEAAIAADGSEAAASSAQASHIDAMLLSPLTSTSLATVESAKEMSLDWWPAGCSTRTKDATNPAIVHVHLADCTGPFGLVHWTGDITVVYSQGANGALHAEATSTDMTVNGHAVTFSRSADITIAGSLVTVNGTSAWTRETALGESISHARSGTVVIDKSTGCRTINGSETSNIGAREIDSTLTDYKICQTATSESCPTGTWTQLHKASGKTVTIVFDGTDQAKVELASTTFDVTLVCGP